MTEDEDQTVCLNDTPEFDIDDQSTWSEDDCAHYEDFEYMEMSDDDDDMDGYRFYRDEDY